MEDLDALLEELFEERGDGAQPTRLAACAPPRIPGLSIIECLLTSSQQVGQP
jgi:hypothetical protein